MIKFEHTDVWGFEHAIRGMRNPFASWDKSDSHWSSMEYEGEVVGNDKYFVGENDLDLMKRLRNAGSDHRKYLRQIMVSVDITAPLYWWKEFDTYKVGTVANSESTMHCIHKKEFTLDDFSCEHLCGEWLDNLKNTIKLLNDARGAYNWCNTDAKKDWWWQMIQLLPSSYNQKRTVTMNYENLLNMYHSRKGHKLDEWKVGFCDWVKSLPYSELIVGD